MIEKWALNKAKEIDEDGFYAYMGMEQIALNFFEIERTTSLSIAIKEIIETYLECYDNNTDFIKYLSYCRVWTEEDIKKIMPEIWEECITLEGLCEYISYFYHVEFWTWENGIFSTQVPNNFEDNRTTINFKGTACECERLMCMMDYEREYGIKITQDDLNKTAEIIAEYGYDIREDYNYKNAEDMLERYNQVFGGII